MMKILKVFMRNKIRGASSVIIGNGDLGSKWEMINKSRYYQILVIIMSHIDSNLV